MSDLISRQAAIDSQGGEEMNKQRKVVITTTYNEMGIIIDTKAEEVAQPNLQPTCNQPATDTISRQAAIELIKNYCENGCDLAEDNWCPSCQREQFIKLLKELPPAQPERKKGKWIYLNGLDAFECSVCGRQMVRNIFDYCPWCGAEMTKGEEDE